MVISPTTKAFTTPVSVTPVATIGNPLQFTLTQQPEITSTPVVSPGLGLISKCLEISDKLPSNIEKKGSVVLYQPAQKASDITHGFLLNVQSGALTQLPQKQNELPFLFTVSTDRKWLAYVQGISGEPATDKLIIADMQGHFYKSIPWKEDWWNLTQWLDSEHLVIIRRQGNVFSTVIFNPFTGQQKEFLPDYPDIYKSYPLPPWEGYRNSLTVYDPGLTRVVYPAENVPLQDTLWDIQEGKLVSHIQSNYHTNFPFGLEPVWSPDGSRFIMAFDLHTSKVLTATMDLFGISRDGQVSRLTYLADQFDGVYISNYRWSPDGRYVAFWLYDKPSWGQFENLAVLDTQTLKVTNYCIPGGEIMEEAAPPVWSPDGTQLVVENIYNNHTEKKVILVDLVNDFAAKIAEGLDPVGWLKEP
jgi:hypothetical protein